MNRFFKKSRSSRKGQESKHIFLDFSNEALKNSAGEQMAKDVLEKETAYKGMFSGVGVIGQQRKAVYVNLKTHELLSEIVKRFDTENMSIGVFVENIVRLHINKHREELLHICQKKENMINNLFADYNDDRNI